MMRIPPARSQWEKTPRALHCKPTVIFSRERIEEGGGRILESHAMLFEIRRCLTLIRLNRHSNRV